MVSVLTPKTDVSSRVVPERLFSARTVREITASILRDLGHVVIEVGSGGGALDLLDRNAQIELAILDFAMPGMNGMEVARQVHTKVPCCPVLFITGYADTSALEDIDDTQIVRKPFIGTELADKVQIALAKGAGNASRKNHSS